VNVAKAVSSIAKAAGAPRVTTHVSPDRRRGMVGTSSRWIAVIEPEAVGVVVRFRGQGARRDERTEVRASSEAELQAIQPTIVAAIRWWAGRLTVHGLVPGRTYRVARPMRDHHGGEFVVGETLVFVEKHFLPYEDGHTIVFQQRRMYLQDGTNDDILDDFDAYLVEV